MWNKNRRYIKVFLYMKAYSYDFWDSCFLWILFYNIFNNVLPLSRRLFSNLSGLVIYPKIFDAPKPLNNVSVLFGVLRCFQQSFKYISYQHFWSIYPDTSKSVAVLITHTPGREAILNKKLCACAVFTLESRRVDSACTKGQSY